MTSEPLYTSRREFLTGSLTFLSAAGTLPLFLGNSALALAAGNSSPGKKNDSDRILVVVQLAGGNDGLNTVIPYEMDGYYKSRPQIAIEKSKVLTLEHGVGLHPSATGLKDLFDDGMMAVVQGVGYPNPNRSHFTSMDIWQTADPNLRKHEGWLGRYFDNACKGADPDPVQGVALMKESPLAMQGDAFIPLAFENPDALSWRAGKRDKLAGATFRKLNNDDGRTPTDSGAALEQFLQRASLDALLGADDIRSAAGRDLGGGSRGGQFGKTLELVVRMIAADMPTRIYYVSLGGFDTHTGQIDRHRRLMSEFGDGMKSFIDQLKEHKLLDRVLVMSFSEFGRRVNENASGGTDHGEAAPMFLFGPHVRAGVHEDHPSLDDLNRGDLQFGCDFRRVYAAVLRDWLKQKPESILGRGFNPLKVVKA